MLIEWKFRKAIFGNFVEILFLNNLLLDNFFFWNFYKKFIKMINNVTFIRYRCNRYSFLLEHAFFTCNYLYKIN